MTLREAAEGATKVLETLLVLDCSFRRSGGCKHANLRLAVELERDLASAAGPPELIDTGVLCDLIDPRLEGDRAAGVAHPPQGRDEDLLRDVFGARVVADHPEDVGPDAGAVAAVELLEGAVVSQPDRVHELVVATGRS